MSEREQTSDVVFEKYYPQHPLPQELKQLPVKDTVCQFCGISYLIHSEIKRLEDEIIALNKKIYYFEELKLSESKYETRFNEKNAEMEKLLLDFSLLNETFTQTKSDRDRFQKEMMDQNDMMLRMEASLSILKVDRDKFLNAQNMYIHHIYELQKRIRSLKEEFNSSKREVLVLLNNNQSDNCVFSSKIKTIIEHMENCRLEESRRYHDEINQASQKLATTFKELEEKDYENSSKLQEVMEKNKFLIQENTALEHQLYEKSSLVSQKESTVRMLQLELEDLHSVKNIHLNKVQNKNDLLKSEKENLKQCLEEKENAIETLQSSIKVQESHVQRLSSVIRENDLQIKEFKDTLHQKDSEMQKLGEEVHSLTRESKFRDTQLSRLNAEISRLMNELESREKEALLWKDEWKDSLQRKLADKDKQMDELQTNYYMKQKELQEEKTEKVKLLNVLKEEEIKKSDLSQKFIELQNKFDLEKKYMTKKLEEDKSVQILENEILDKENLIDKMENDLIKKNNEITALQQMVHRECEERNELTEALNQAREQLLLLGDFHVQKAPNNLPPISYSKSNSSSTSASEKRSSISTTKPAKISLEKINSSSKNSVISTKRNLERLFNT